MQIVAPCVVSLSWKLSDGQDRPIDESPEPMDFFYGGGDLLPTLEEGLAGFEAGDSVKLHLEPEQAFGDYRAELVCFEDRKIFPEQLETGMAFEGLPPGHATPDMPVDSMYIVTEIYPSHVVLDGNHPLAGLSLRVDMRIHAVREATAEEIESHSVGGTPITVLGSRSGLGGSNTLH
jgi:FKBP-type peptidyl-prolyl cis-trans isomerase SlyD